MMNCFKWHESDQAQILARSDQLPHALLFRGAKGIGKLAFAKALAASLLCEKAARSAPACGSCASCQWIASDSHPDYRLIQSEADAAEESDNSGDAVEKKKQRIIAIGQIRMLRDFINMTSHQGGVKVIVIHPAESLNSAAFNALLKSLEEPPAGTYFLLVSHRPHLLPATIKSRCQQVALTSPGQSAAEQWLKEKGVDNAALALAQAGGAPLLALELNEDEYWSARSQFLQGLGARDFDALVLAERSASQPVALLLGWLQKWSLDLVSKKFTNRIRYNPDHDSVISALAQRVDGLATLRYHRRLIKMQRNIEHPLNTRLIYEDLLLGYARLVQAGATEH
jgi:DNA polymerase III subunit delta'